MAIRSQKPFTGERQVQDHVDTPPNQGIKKRTSPSRPPCLVHSCPGRLPRSHQFLVALFGVALVDVVNVSSCFRFAHSDYLPTQLPGVNPEFYCAFGSGRIPRDGAHFAGDVCKERHNQGLWNCGVCHGS